MGNKQERELLDAIHKKRKLEPKAQKEFELFQELLPAIRAAIKAGGGADQILKRSTTIAAMELLKATQSEKDEVRLKAATEILNRTEGKPVERSINVYGDISKMNERDVDSQILALIQKTGANKLLETSLGVPTKKRSQKRKPRKSDPLVIEAEFTESTQGAVSPAEAGTSAGTEDQRDS